MMRPLARTWQAKHKSRKQYALMVSVGTMSGTQANGGGEEVL